MNYVNGADHNTEQTVGVGPAVFGDATSAPPERWRHVRERLAEPFDPGEIKWRVAATSTQSGKNGPRKRGRLVAYADQRAYTDRLNEIFGEWGWTRAYDVQVAQNFERPAPGDKNRTAAAAKLVVVCKVTIQGLGTHTGVGEEWADDPNAATRAEAQAFKRACACFGLGRYLYNLGAIWADLDQNDRPVQTPDLPEWARPPGAGHAAARPSPVRHAQRTPPSEEMLTETRNLQQKVGNSLAAFVRNTYGGGTDPEKQSDAVRAVIVAKLTDIGKGVYRLRRAVAAIGDTRYAAICRELGLASTAIDDIPDRATLGRLVARAESEAGRSKGNASNGRSQHIGDARGRLLQAARQMADKTGKSFAEIITEASGGKLSLDKLKDLTAADVPAILEAVAKIAGLTPAGSRSEHLSANSFPSISSIE